MGSLEDLLRACVVRVEGGPMPGTGFFVAPGRVLTCAHVVGTHGSLIAIRLDGDRTGTCGAPVLYCDQGRPIPDLAGDYPDLALLDVDLGAHPCVAIDLDWPQLDDVFQAYGFPSEGGSVVRTPVRLSYSGKKGADDRAFIDLASDMPVTPGMSGAPLFSVRTAAVCGVLVATRSPSQAHGGLAVAWSALGPVADELLTVNERFHARDERWTRARGQRRRHLRFGLVHTVTHFTGRSVELDALATRIQASDRAVITQAITGLGGVGKTQLTARYAQRHGDRYDIVAWIRAEDSGTADLAALAATLGLEVGDLTPQERADQALRWLERCDERWLLVLDNLTGPAQLESCCPAGGNGHVLITSRNRDLEHIAPTLSIDVFDEDTATEYLLARTGRTDERQAARTLARALGGLPLALTHAGAYCKATSFSDYHALLKDLPPAELYDRSPEAFYRQTVASTWQPSIRAASGEAPLAHQVLAMAAHLAPDDIPLALFNALIDPTDARQRKQLADAITALDRYSLVTIERETLSVHRLLQRVILDTGTDAELLNTAGHATLHALIEAMPADPQQPQHWPLYEQLLAHILRLAETLNHPADAAPQLIALLNHGCDYLLHGGTPQRALETTTRSARYAADLLGPEHPTTLSALSNLASSYRQAGRPKDAIGLEERVVADRERLSGDEHPNTLAARSNLALSYQQARRTDDAIALGERVIADSEWLLGDEHPSTLAARSNLANCYQDAGRTSDAISLLERVVADSERLLGNEHPNTLAARANLAVCYRDAGRTSDAISLLERVVADRERLLGDQHPDTLDARTHLASCYQQARRTTDAIGLQEQVLADRQRLLGDEHPHTLTARNNLAVSYQQAGRTDDAISLLERVVADRERLLGDEHPHTLIARNNLALSYQQAGRTDDAITLGERVVADSKRLLGDKHPHTLTARSNVALSYWEAGRTDDAITLGERVVADSKRLLGDQHPNTLTARAVLREWAEGWNARTGLLAGTTDGPAKPADAPAFPGVGRAREDARVQRPEAGATIFNVPVTTRRFVGREQQLQRLEEGLSHEGTVAITEVHAIHGMGGVGKTQLAARYARGHRDDYDVIWWLRAEQQPTLHADFAGLAVMLGLVGTDADEQDAITTAREWLEGHGRWLLLFDSATAPDAIADLLPEGNAGGHVLITSRARADWRSLHAQPLPLDVWKREESRKFLRERTDEQDVDAVDAVAEALGDLPLALEQAATYTTTNAITLTDYLQRLRDRAPELFRAGEPVGYEHTVAAVWQLAFEQVAQYPIADRLLAVCAHLAPERIPREVLEAATGISEREFSGHAIELLLRYALLTPAAEQTFDMHRLIGKLTRERHPPAAQAWAAAVAVTALGDLWPNRSWEHEQWPACERLLAHALTATQHNQRRTKAPVQTANVLERAGLHLAARAQLTSARQLVLRALAIKHQIYGSEHEQIATTLNNLGAVQRKLGELEMARLTQQTALMISEAVYGPEHPLVAITLNNLSGVQHELGELEAARETLQRANAINEAETLPVRGNFATPYQRAGRGRTTDANKLLRQVLAYSKRILGPEYPDTLTARADLTGSDRSPIRKAPTPGPNDPCWCGSGKKYKRCHWPLTPR